MRKLANKINEQGFILDPVLIDDEVDTITNDLILDPVPEGFYMPRWDSSQKKWVEGRPYLDILNEKRREKLTALADLCQQSILGYFTATVDGVSYQFSFDAEAQANFTGTMAFFSQGLITEIEWTAWQNGIAKRIKLNKEQFMNVAMTAFAHKNEHISRLRNDLQQKVENAGTIPDIQAVLWGTEEVTEPPVQPQATIQEQPTKKRRWLF